MSDDFFEGTEDGGWDDEAGPPVRRAEGPAPNWATCTGIVLGEVTLQAGISRGNDLLIALTGRGGVQRRLVDRRTVVRLFDPLAEGREEFAPGLVLDRHDAGIRVTRDGIVLGKIATAELEVAWGLRPVVGGRPKPFRGYS
ncbi:hypothetical protein EON79_16035 [bacterium]|nr:MAG: hypothetical protein EON79_16035 [bacterium]